MFRRLSTKWVLTVLAAVIVPFLGYAWFLSQQMKSRESEVVEYLLSTLASELADRVDNDVAQRKWDVETVLAKSPMAAWAADISENYDPLREQLGDIFNQFYGESRFYDRALLVDPKGKVLVMNERASFPADFEASVRARDLSGEPWFQQALRGETVLVDQHVSDLVPPPAHPSAGLPERYHFGIAAPVRDILEPSLVTGVVYVLVNWAHVQKDVIKPPQPSLSGDNSSNIYASCYAWLWESDCDTIIAHLDTSLYGKSVARDTGLPQLPRAALASDAGMFPDYAFRGVQKKGAFKHCRDRAHGGLGWVVGVGINDEDTFVRVQELRRVLIGATVLVLGTVLLLTIAIARRTTAPIRALQEQTQRIAAGDFATRLDVRSHDELGELAQSFDRMAQELDESRSKLIKAEKDAAWREMARQVAHEIKNPLTPISLSATLLERAKNDKSPEFDSIFKSTMAMIQRQVEAMRQIASDFSAFAGARKPQPESVDVRALLGEVLELNAAWARELKIEVRFEGECGPVFADRGELRRVLINLVSNALEAMQQGGLLDVRLARVVEERVWSQIAIRDTGVGISTEIRKHLFEPYFTTRTHGTGLGLAICQRLVDEMGGTIELVPAPEPGARGTIARIRLPEQAA
ncbi:MAG: HAMP domain-containing protein [Planctomycetes bacterium]|nr:HAMP domain-containing protein [Planctomycetota bacterium]